MSHTLGAWLVAVAVCTILAFTHRAIWGWALYGATFFAHPAKWWWGHAIAAYRWNLAAAVIFLVALILKKEQTQSTFKIDQLKNFNNSRIDRLPIEWVAIMILVNASFIQFILTGEREIGFSAYLLQVKFIILYFLIIYAIKDSKDLLFAILVIVIGMGYIGYEATINNRGVFSHGRLEDIGAPGADTANFLASLGVTILPLAGYLVIVGKSTYRWLAVICTPLIFNVVLLCNSRGAFLAGIFSLIVILLGARGKQRKYALLGLILAVLATLILLKDPQIIQRFETTFTSNLEELDSSAANRLLFWNAALHMIADHPLGAGGDAFEKVYGEHYLEEMGIYRARAIHNGYLKEACQWGIQGLILRILFIFFGILNTFRVRHFCNEVLNKPKMAFLGTCLVASMSALLVSGMFSNTLDKEWGVWIVALMTAYSRTINDNFSVSIQNHKEAIL